MGLSSDSKWRAVLEKAKLGTQYAKSSGSHDFGGGKTGLPPDPFCQECVLPRQATARKCQLLCQLQPGGPAQSPSARVCSSKPLLFGHGPHSCSVSTVNCLHFCLAGKSLTYCLFLTHPRAARAASLLASTPTSLASKWARAGWKPEPSWRERWRRDKGNRAYP